MKFLNLLLLASLFLAGCAKERKYKKKYKGNSTHIKKKHLVNMCEGGCLYLPTVREVPKDIPQARPFSVGDEKIVNLSIEKDQIIFRQTEEDNRYSENKNNLAPVFSLDIEHIDYRCKKNSKDKCSREEEENKDKHWSKKKFVTLKKDEINILETNTMPMNMANLFVKCFPTVSSRIKDIEIVPNQAMNITVEKTYSTAHVACQGVKNWGDLVEKMKNFTFTIDYHFSIMKLSTLASKDFQVVDYPYEDHDLYGFFTTDKSRADIDNNKTMYDKKYMMKRWKPNRTITFHLDEKFYTKDMSSLKQMMEVSVSSINKSLKQEKIPLNIELKKGNNKDIGKANKSFFTLVKDPLASGVIGYGPSVANPRTGEILSAQVVVYYGTILRYIQHTYNEVVQSLTVQKRKLQKEEREREERKRQRQEEEKNKTKPKGEVTKELVADAKAKSYTDSIKPVLEKAISHAHELHSHVHTGITHTDYTIQTLQQNYDEYLAKEFTNDLKEQFAAKNFKFERLAEELTEATLHEYSKNNMYHGSLVNFSGFMASTLTKLTASAEALGSQDNLRPWHLLNKKEKQIVIDEMLPHVIIPTMIHEIGHTLGLRHNFMGSVDEENFYSIAERKKLKMPRHVPYSSVMDYGKSNLNSLTVLGKYDLAALKFGYKREVELKDNKVLKLGKSSFMKIQSSENNSDIEEQLKKYSFCTDEHAFVSPDCNRFDEGTNFSEIVDSLIKSYKDRYDSRNFRNYRKSFSAQDDGGYAGSVQNTFLKLRIFFERYITIRNKLGIPDDSEIWEKNEFLKEIKAASDKTFDFFVDVIKTSELSCVVMNPQGRPQILPLRIIKSPFGNPVSCFDAKNLNTRALEANGLNVIGQMGKAISHIKSDDMSPDLRPTTTEISVKGIYLDKLLAMEMLTKRELGISIFDEYTNNYFDISTNLEKGMKLITEIINDEIVNPQVITFEDGSQEVIPIPTSMEDGHIVRSSFSSSVNKRFDLKSETNYLNEIFLKMFKKNHLSKKDVFGTKKFLEIFKSIKVGKLTDWYDTEDVKLYKIQNDQGEEIGRYLLNKDNTIATGLADMALKKSKLGKYSNELIFAVMMEKMKPVPGPEPSPKPTPEEEAKPEEETKPLPIPEMKPLPMPEPDPEEKKALKQAVEDLKDVEVSLIQRYLQGQLPSQEEINRSLELLSL